MKSAFAALPLALAVLTGCPSKDSGSSSGATTPPSGTVAANGTGTVAATGTGTGTGTGPLANLESQPSVAEAWVSQDGTQQMPMVYFKAQNVRVSAQCKQPNGQLSCDAIRQLRNGQPIEIPARELGPSTSAGTKACLKLHYHRVTGRNPAGAEDGFCTFPDGSMVSTGALEQYGLRILQ